MLRRVAILLVVGSAPVSGVTDPPVVVETGPRPQASVVWLHGLGADGHDFESLVPELRLSVDVRFVFPHAPRRAVTINDGFVMRAWYDVFDLSTIAREDQAGIVQADRSIVALLDAEIARGIPARRIVLAGFSQGGAMALYSGLRYRRRLAGIVALSSYLPLAARLGAEMSPANRGTPILLAHGLNDPVVPFALGERTERQLREAGLPVEFHRFPMEHTVIPEEVRLIRAWLERVLIDDGDS